MPVTESMRALLAPRAIAVVGASQNRGRGNGVVANLKAAGFAGEIFAVNPRYREVLGCPCVPTVHDLPAAVECVVVAVAAAAACDVLEDAHAHGVVAAIVLAAGFGEGGHGEARASRLRALADKGMRICGPNCFGLINLSSAMAAYSGPLPLPLRRGPVAIVSQSGGLGANLFAPLMSDRQIGFGYFISCGNQIGTTVEDYVEYLVDDPTITVIAAVIEELKNPRKLAQIARTANERRKSLVFLQAGRSAVGKILVQSHTGALAANSEIMAAFLRRCGIVQVGRYDEFVETVALFAVAPRNPTIGDGLIVLSGSGGGAAIAADALNDAGAPLATLHPATRERIAALLPEFGSITNPIDGTGAIYDDPALLPKILDAIIADPARPVLAASLSARAAGSEIMCRFARSFAQAARASDRTVVAYQYSPLGGPLDPEIIETLHSAQVPLLLGTANAMGALGCLQVRRDFWLRAGAQADKEASNAAGAPGERTEDGGDWSFLAARSALLASGIAVAETELARSEGDAVALLRKFDSPLALKVEAAGLLHKSDIGCVRVNCASEHEVREAYRDLIQNANKAGFGCGAGVLVQPMVAGVAEVYAGIIDDPQFGPAICFGLGGLFVEILRDTVIEMAPLSHAEALAMIRGVKGAAILDGARGCERVDIDALARLLVALGQFALANRGRFCALDLNPIMAGASGAVVVDIAVEPIGRQAIVADAAE
jgi:acyl-CoA synthetase (NDP forming)